MFQPEKLTKEQEIAAQLAATLLQELAFPYPIELHHKQSLIGAPLPDEPPPRSELVFQKKGGADAPKARFAPEFSAGHEKNLIEVFCFFHGEFVLMSGMDVDHMFSHSSIREKQKALLEHLNGDPSFTEIFLVEPGMSDFFRRDAKDGKVKGTKYFYKLCYNAVGNLWLLCHSCNVHKSDLDPMDWFVGKPLYGGRFVASVYESGGLQPGIIIDRIYKISGTEAVLDIGNRIVILHAEGEGLGQYVRRWFAKEHYEIFKTHKQFYSENYGTLKSEISEIEGIIDSDAPDKLERIKKRYIRLQKRLSGINITQKAIMEAYNALSSSEDSDSSFTREADAREKVRVARNNLFAGHEIRKIMNFIDVNFPSLEKREIWLVYENKEWSIDWKDWRKFSQAFSRIEQDLATATEEGGVSKELMKRELLHFLEENHRPLAEEYRASKEKSMKKFQASEAKAEEAVRLREEETRLREEETRLREEETRLRVSAELRAEEREREVVELKRQLVSQQQSRAIVSSPSAQSALLQTGTLFGEGGEPAVKRPKEEGEDLWREAGQGSGNPHPNVNK